MAIDLPTGEERSREMARFIISGVALKFYNEFCLALIDWGMLPGFPVSPTYVIIDVCKKRMEKRNHNCSFACYIEFLDLSRSNL